jgi:hypothetical protein
VRRSVKVKFGLSILLLADDSNQRKRDVQEDLFAPQPRFLECGPGRHGADFGVTVCLKLDLKDQAEDSRS